MRQRVLLIMVAGLLAGCSSIPSSGPIVKGERVDVLQNDVNVRVIARPPARGMDQESLVRGFLAACASVADGDDTARMYLTADASASWSPNRLIDVYDITGLTVTADHTDSVKVVAPLLGTIDATRRYRIADPGATMSVTMHLTQVDGQWRIDQAPPALFLGEGDVARSFRAHAIYFLDRTLHHLVPEFVMVPTVSQNAPTAVMDALLAGPADTQALTTAIPPSTMLVNAGSMPDYGVVNVPLSNDVLAASGAERSAMIAQITWTLTQLPAVGAVRITVGTVPLQDSTGRSTFTTADLASFDPSRSDAGRALVFVANGEVKTLRAGHDETLVPSVRAAEVSASSDLSLIVGISEGHRFLEALRGDAVTTLAAGGDLAAPTVVTGGDVWYLDREANAGGMFVWSPASGVSQVATGLPKRARILDYSLAPDGIRIALIVNDGATTTLRVGAVIRRPDGSLRLEGLARVEQRLSAVSTVAWSSQSSLAVLGSVGAVAVQPIGISLPTGALTLLGGPANPVSLAAAPGEPVVVGDQSGQLWQLIGERWTSSELGTAPRYLH